MRDYDRDLFEPPAPVAQITVRNPESGATVSNVLMLLDTGSDVTLLPEVVIRTLGLSAVAGRQYELIGFDGSRSFVPVVHLELVFCRRVFRGQFLPLDQGWDVLGRNVLNAVPILLDGPKLTWSESTISKPPDSR